MEGIVGITVGMDGNGGMVNLGTAGMVGTTEGKPGIDGSGGRVAVGMVGMAGTVGIGGS